MALRSDRIVSDGFGFALTMLRSGRVIGLPLSLETLLNIVYFLKALKLVIKYLVV